VTKTTVFRYEQASKKDPTNEEFLSRLFMSYVRLEEYKKQQITAINLYKIKQKKPYYFWSVMSLGQLILITKTYTVFI
jgi:N-terminal acetyltransferase B complex non-catalytic subunit